MAAAGGRKGLRPEACDDWRRHLRPPAKRGLLPRAAVIRAPTVSATNRLDIDLTVDAH
jgi:hypothetical protein